MVAMTQTPRGNQKRRVRRAAAVVLTLLLVGCQDPNPNEETLSNHVPAGSATDYALRFDGSNDYATLGTARFPMPTLPQCLSLWVKLGSIGTRQALLTLRRDDSGNELGFSETGVPTLWRIWNPEVLVEAMEPLAVGDWHHLAYVHTDNQQLLYVDGTAVGSSAAGPDNRSPTSGYIGSYNGTKEMFEGELDELRVWAMARSAADVQMEFEGNGAVSDPDLVGYYSFDESDGARVYDRSTNGNHATLGDGVPDYMPERVPSERP